MLGIFSKIFGGKKSDKDVNRITPIVAEINQHLAAYQSLSNDELRGKTLEFRQRIKEHLSAIDTQISGLRDEATAMPADADPAQREALFAEVDKLRKQRDEQIEDILEKIHAEAFAVVKETARRFKENEFISKR